LTNNILIIIVFIVDHLRY